VNGPTTQGVWHYCKDSISSRCTGQRPTKCRSTTWKLPATSIPVRSAALGFLRSRASSSLSIFVWISNWLRMVSAAAWFGQFASICSVNAAALLPSDGPNETVTGAATCRETAKILKAKGSSAGFLSKRPESLTHIGSPGSCAGSSSGDRRSAWIAFGFGPTANAKTSGWTSRKVAHRPRTLVSARHSVSVHVPPCADAYCFSLRH